MNLRRVSVQDCKLWFVHPGNPHLVMSGENNTMHVLDARCGDKITEFTITNVRLDSIVDVQANLQRNLIAIMATSGFSLVARDGTVCFAIASDAANLICAFEWLTSTAFAVVYQNQVTIYSITSLPDGEIAVVQRKNINTTFQWFKYNHDTKLLVLCCTSRLKIYRVGFDASLVRLKDLKLTTGEPTGRHFHILEMYSKVYIIQQVNSELHVHEIHGKKNSLKFIVDVKGAQPKIFINVEDNLLIVHHLDELHSGVYDFGKYYGLDVQRVTPIAKLTYGLIPQMEGLALVSGALNIDLSLSGGQFMSTPYSLYKFNIDLFEMVSEMVKNGSSGTSNQLVDTIGFLGRRRYPAEVTKPCLRHLLSRALSPDTRQFELRQIFDVYNRTIDCYSQSGQTNVQSLEFQLQLVELIETNVNLCSNMYLSSALLQFIQSTRVFSAVHIDLYMCLVGVYVRSDRLLQLGYLVSTGIVPDVISIGKMLVRVNVTLNYHKETKCVGIAMLVRLGAHELVIDAYVQCGDPMNAIFYDMPHFKRIDVVSVLDCALRHANKTVFLNAMQYLAEDALVSEIGVGVPFDSRMARFVAIYRERWSPRIMMESV